MSNPSGKRRWRALSFGALLAALVLGLAPYAQLRAEPIVGRAIVIDGDTLEIRGERIRLHGVDAPEGRQLCRDAECQLYRCGQKAANTLADKVEGRVISCAPVDVDQYGRTVAVCRDGALDLNGWLVAAGLALAYRHYSTAYVPQEAAARRGGRGIWAGTFTEPWDWRRSTRSNHKNKKEGGLAPSRSSCLRSKKEQREK